MMDLQTQIRKAKAAASAAAKVQSTKAKEAKAAEREARSLYTRFVKLRQRRDKQLRRKADLAGKNGIVFRLKAKSGVKRVFVLTSGEYLLPNKSKQARRFRFHKAGELLFLSTILDVSQDSVWPRQLKMGKDEFSLSREAFVEILLRIKNLPARFPGRNGLVLYGYSVLDWIDPTRSA